VKGVVEYIGDGAYSVHYTPTVSGTHTIAVQMAKVQETQTVTIALDNIKNCGEEFSLTFGSFETGKLAWTLDASDLEVALENMDPSVEVEVVTVANGESCHFPCHLYFTGWKC